MVRMARREVLGALVESLHCAHCVPKKAWKIDHYAVAGVREVLCYVTRHWAGSMLWRAERGLSAVFVSVVVNRKRRQLHQRSLARGRNAVLFEILT